MFNLSDIVGQATQLFHSPNIDELMNPDAAADLLTADLSTANLSTIVADTGLDPEALAGVSAEEVLANLAESGIDPAALTDSPIVEQVRALIGR